MSDRLRRLLALPGCVALGGSSAVFVHRPVLGLSVAATAGATTLAVLAVRRFETFVLLLLLVRPLLDLTKGVAPTPLLEPTSLAGLALIGAGALWLHANPAPGAASRPSLVGLASVTFVVVGIASSVVSTDPLLALAGALRVLAGAMMFLVIERLLFLGMPVRRLLLALAAGTLAPLALAWLGPWVGLDVNHVKDGVVRAALDLLPVEQLRPLPDAVPRRRRGVRRLRTPAAPPVVLAWIGVMAVQLVATETRGAWVAALLGIAVVALLMEPRILGGVAVAAMVVVLAVPSVTSRVTDLVPDPDQPRRESSLAWQFDHWQEVAVLNEDARVLGIGIGVTRATTVHNKDPHNDYLRAFVETGWVGLLSYLFLVWAMLRTAHRTLREVAPDDPLRGVVVGTFAYLVAFAVASLAENLITTVSFLWHVMPLVALTSWVARNPARPHRWPVPSRGRPRPLKDEVTP